MDWLCTSLNNRNIKEYLQNPCNLWKTNNKGHAVHKVCDCRVKIKSESRLKDVFSPDGGKEYDLADREQTARCKREENPLAAIVARCSVETYNRDSSNTNLIDE